MRWIKLVRSFLAGLFGDVPAFFANQPPLVGRPPQTCETRMQEALTEDKVVRFKQCGKPAAAVWQFQSGPMMTTCVEHSKMMAVNWASKGWKRIKQL